MKTMEENTSVADESSTADRTIKMAEEEAKTMVQAAKTMVEEATTITALLSNEELVDTLDTPRGFTY